MTSVLHCNQPGCEHESGHNQSDHWMSVRIEYDDDVYVMHYCMNCWTDMLLRKAVAGIQQMKDEEQL